VAVLMLLKTQRKPQKASLRRRVQTSIRLHFGSATSPGTERLQARLCTSDRPVRGRKAARRERRPAEGQPNARAIGDGPASEKD
jgi:hypothetical protein